MNAELELDVADQAPAQIACDDERLVTTIVNARTPDDYLSAIQDAQPAEEADTAPVVASEADLPALPQLIIRAGESGGVLTQSEFQITKFCAEHKLKKRTADGLLCMLRRDDFVPEEIRAETIRELEKIVTTSSGSKIYEYDFWTKDDGKQEVKLYLRSLRQIIEGILAYLGFRNLQYLWFEYREVDGERVFGPANGAIWWQITVRRIGRGHVLIAIIIFQDGSWVRTNLSCEPLYGEFNFLIWYPKNVLYRFIAADAFYLFWQLPCSIFMKAHG